MSRASKKITKLMKQNRTYAEKVALAGEAYRRGRKVKKYGFEDLPEARFNRWGIKNNNA